MGFIKKIINKLRPKKTIRKIVPVQSQSIYSSTEIAEIVPYKTDASSLSREDVLRNSLQDANSLKYINPFSSQYNQGTGLQGLYGVQSSLESKQINRNLGTDQSSVDPNAPIVTTAMIRAELIKPVSGKSMINSSAINDELKVKNIIRPKPRYYS